MNKNLQLLLLLLSFHAALHAQFITRWKADSGSTFVTIPTHEGSTYNYTVNWGDGSPEDTGITEDVRHIYATPGEYDITITGDFPRIYFNIENQNSRRIIAILRWGDQQWTSMEGAFAGCVNLQGDTASDTPDLSNVTNTSRMFQGAEKFNQDIGNWDVSNVENMQSMFYGASSFNQDIEGWDVSNVKDMRAMFRSASSFNQNIGGWDVANVTDMQAMFHSASAFNGNIENWGNKVSTVILMNSMFRGASNFNRDIGTWDVSNVRYMAEMFNGATNFNGNIGEWGSKVSKVQSMASMFSNASNFNQDIGGWDVSGTQGAAGLTNMFFQATSFNQDISDWDVSNVTVLNDMFTNATSFNQDISGWDVSNVTSMYRMFFGAENFDQNLGAWNVSKVTTMYRMFFNVKLSTDNYDGMLQGWSSKTLQNDVVFSGGNSKYCNASSERQKLIGDLNWVVTDDGLGCSLSSPDVLTETFKVYPIPTSGSITVNVDANVEAVTLYNLQGAEVQSKAQEYSETIDLSGLSSGTYILKVQTNKGSIIQRIIKE